MLPPTLGIKDPDTRQFADALINVLDLRSGNTDKNSPDRFITARDINDALNGSSIGSGIGQAGGVIGSGSTPGSVTGAITALTQSIRNSLLDQILRTPIEQINPNEGLVQSLRSDLQAQVTKLDNGLTQLNTISQNSESFTARTLYALKGTVEGSTGLPYAQAFIADMNNLDVTSNHAAVTNLRGLMGTVYDPATGLAKAHADIIELNKIDVTSTSAMAQRVRLLSSEVGVGTMVFVQASQPVSTFERAIQQGDMWVNTAVPGSSSVYIFDGSTWQYSPNSRIGGSLSRVLNEEETRNSQTTALAKAVNTIWASVGNGQALVQSGFQTDVNAAAAQGTKWDQVQAAVTDPNTGQINATSIKAEAIAYANVVTGVLTSSYSVRTTLTADGRTIVGGFGLMATTDPGNPPGARIDFGVNADTFWVGNTSGIGQYPFIVRTSDSYASNGELIQAGAYINRAFIANGDVGSAHIENGAITSAKIRDLQVETLKIGLNAVTVPFSSGLVNGTDFSDSGMPNSMTASQYLLAKSNVIAMCSYDVVKMGFHGAACMLAAMKSDGGWGLIMNTSGFSYENFGNGSVFGSFTAPVDGFYYIAAGIYTTSGDGPLSVTNCTIAAMGGKR